MPLFLVLFLYPEYVLSLLFGPDYVPAAPALRILAIGFILEALPGPNAATLIALGESRFLMWANVAATCVSLALNIVLIPKLGIIGAAIASAVSLTIFSIIRGAKVYSLCRAYPFSWNLLKPLAVSIALALLFQLIFGKFIMVTWWMLPLLFALFYAIYGTATVLTRSFDQEDIVTLLMLEKRSGINAEPAKKILRRFI
jgi:O-antigen/teichoic acid export membrane protein